MQQGDADENEPCGMSAAERPEATEKHRARLLTCGTCVKCALGTARVAKRRPAPLGVSARLAIIESASGKRDIALEAMRLAYFVITVYNDPSNGQWRNYLVL